METYCVVSPLLQTNKQVFNFIEKSNIKFSGIDFKEDFESCMGNAMFAFRPTHHCLGSLALLLANMRDSQTSCLALSSIQSEENCTLVEFDCESC